MSFYNEAELAGYMTRHLKEMLSHQVLGVGSGMPEAHWGTGGQTFLKGTFGRGIRKEFGRGILKTKRYIVLTVNANCLTALLC